MLQVLCFGHSLVCPSVLSSLHSDWPRPDHQQALSGIHLIALGLYVSASRIILIPCHRLSWSASAPNGCAQVAGTYVLSTGWDSSA